MKAKKRMMMSLLIAIVLLFSTATVAYARTVYYPTEGVNSGYCNNAKVSSICKYENLPVGVMNINYFLETNKTMELRFYKDETLKGGYDAATITNNTNGGTTQVTLTSSGTFYVVVCTKNEDYTTFTYAYDLFRN